MFVCILVGERLRDLRSPAVQGRLAQVGAGSVNKPNGKSRVGSNLAPITVSSSFNY